MIRSREFPVNYSLFPTSMNNSQESRKMVLYLTQALAPEKGSCSLLTMRALKISSRKRGATEKTGLG